MNVNTAIFFVAAVIASANVFAGERAGRDSVHAQPGRALSAPVAGKAAAGNGRDSVYAQDITIRSRAPGRHARMTEKLGRA